MTPCCTVPYLHSKYKGENRSDCGGIFPKYTSPPSGWFVLGESCGKICNKILGGIL